MNRRMSQITPDKTKSGSKMLPRLNLLKNNFELNKKFLYNKNVKTISQKRSYQKKQKIKIK